MARRATTALRRRSGLRSFPPQAPTASPGLRIEHRLLQLSFCQKLLLLRRSLRLETGVLLLQLGQPFGLLGLHAAVLLLPAVVGRLGHLNGAADVSDGLALGDQLLSGLELADDLLGCVADAFHGGVPGPVWPDEDSHSLWTDFRGPRQPQKLISSEQKRTSHRRAIEARKMAFSSLVNIEVSDQPCFDPEPRLRRPNPTARITSTATPTPPGSSHAEVLVCAH